MNHARATYSAVLGLVLSTERKKRGMEQGEMASLMGLSQASYSRLESGKATFNFDQMYQAAAALGLSASALVAEVDRYCAHLSSENITVEALPRRNASGNSESKAGVGEFVAGAALGAILLSILTSR